jgi:two-component system KDP operon response regulator KdpE
MPDKRLMNTFKVLIVDYQLKWISLIRQILLLDGYSVIVENHGEKAIQVATKELPDLVLLEPNLPGELNGFEITRHIRKFSNIPIIMLSEKSETEYVLKGFNAGVDDYITKPFDSKILLARIRAVLNRVKEKIVLPEEIRCNNLVINPVAHRVTVDGIEIILTETEYNLLLELARNSNKVLLHEQLLCAVWGPEYQNEVIYLRSFIHTLRRKIEMNPSQPRQIHNRSGIGYILVSEPSETVER